MTRPKRASDSLTLADPRTFKALASPHRLEVIAAFVDGAGPLSIADLGRRLGRTPHSLYYHVKHLAEAGVLLPADTRRRGRRDEQLWRLAAGKILLSPLAGAPGSTMTAARAVDAMLRLTSRELQAAIRRDDIAPGELSPVIGMRMKGRLDQPTLRRITRLIGQIETLVRKANPRGTPGAVYALTMVLTPTGVSTGGERR